MICSNSMALQQPIRVRIAPSPTGYLHLGTVRTALYNYLFAKQSKGAFVVRIEDTDQSRSLPLYEQDILDGLSMLGLRWDEGPDIGGPYGPYRQSERTNIYTSYIHRLVKEGKVYKCFCTKEQLEEERRAMLAQGLAPKYSGQCRNLSLEQITAYEKEGRESILRIKIPSDVVVEFPDLVRGKVSIHSNTIGDFVIAKDEESPLYNFAVVVDDEEMKISHVIRGEDHISNTPKQILIQQALGISSPVYAHLPLILAPDRSKLSKRSLETSFIEYVRDGYLPEALLNFIVLLGWHPQGNEEVFSLANMIEKFSFRRVQKAGAVFSIEKLQWFNERYIRTLSLESLLAHVRPFLPSEWLLDEQKVGRALRVERDRMKKLSDFVEQASFFFEPLMYDVDLLRWQDTAPAVIEKHLRAVRDMIDRNQLDAVLPYADREGRGEVLWPLRVALSGLRNSPGPLEIISVLGRDESIQRIDTALEKISSHKFPS